MHLGEISSHAAAILLEVLAFHWIQRIAGANVRITIETSSGLEWMLSSRTGRLLMY